uniref:Uncharacterized protein n=1 Tax=Anguilla anguilla TaxID=7936 RepID=A0A0E9WZJ7_ANGAN
MPKNTPLCFIDESLCLSVYKTVFLRIILSPTVEVFIDLPFVITELTSVLLLLNDVPNS